jgi:hypothetical protein
MRTTALILLLVLAVVFTGCGEDSPETAGEPSTGETPDVETVEETALYPEGTLDPATVTPDIVISAVDLNREFFAWDGMEVTIAAYPYIWYGDSTEVENELRLVSEPGSTDELARAMTAAVAGEVVHRNEIIAFTGTVASGWQGPELEDAVFAEPPDELVPVETSPHAYAGETIPIDQFSELYNVWLGMEVTIEGYYSSTTTSTTDYGVTVRVDLSDPQATSNKLVGCEMADLVPDDVSEAMSANRAGVQIRGVVTGSVFGNVSMEDCVIINR